MSTVAYTPPNATPNKHRGPAAPPKKPCDRWRMDGACPFGLKCRFEHAEGDKGILRVSAALDGKGREEDGSPVPFHATAISSPTTSRPIRHDPWEGSWRKTNTNVASNASRFPTLCRDWEQDATDGNTWGPRSDEVIDNQVANISPEASVSNWRKVPGNPKWKRSGGGAHVSQKQMFALKQEGGEGLEKEKLDREDKRRKAKTKAKAEEEGKERKDKDKDERERERGEKEERRQNEEAERASRLEADMRRMGEEVKREELWRKAEEVEERRQKAEEEAEQARLRNAEVFAEEMREYQKQMKARWKKEASSTEQCIIEETNLVTFGAGMNVQRVISGFNLRRISFKNLPDNATVDEVAAIFEREGFAASEFFVQEFKWHGDKCEAVVLASVCRLSAEGFPRVLKFRNKAVAFEFNQNANQNGMTAVTSQNAPALTISWCAPSESIIATYGSVEQARVQCERLKGKIWNGRRITATPSDHLVGGRHVASSDILILGCAPGTAISAEFHGFLKTSDIKLLISADYDPIEVYSCIREQLRQLPGVQMDTYEELSDGSIESRIKIGFDSSQEAKRAHDALDKKRLKPDKFPLLRSSLPSPIHYSIRIPRQQYEAQQDQWDSLSARANIEDQGDVDFRVLGYDKKAVGQLKVRVETMAAGETLDATQWHASFATATGRIFFDRVFSETKVYVRNNIKTRCLSLCGRDPARIREAGKMIEDEVERLSEMTTTMTLDSTNNREFMTVGWRKLKELLGEENVIVNVSKSTPYTTTVTVKGGSEAAHHLHRVIDESAAHCHAASFLNPDEAERGICTVCGDVVSSPEQLGCGHTACSGCILHFLKFAAARKKFPLVCMGNGGACRVPISIPFIRRFLTPPLFENLAEAAFKAYLRQHPQELKYCKTPECVQIYARRPLSNLRNVVECPACFSTVCTMCSDGAHVGVTCDGQRIPQYQHAAAGSRLRTSGNSGQQPAEEAQDKKDEEQKAPEQKSEQTSSCITM